MRFVVQRVGGAEVRVAGETVGEIGQGLLVLCGISRTDTEDVADRMVKKLCALRIFSDSEGKTNLSVTDIGGGLLIVSQFTLYADLRSGNRPGFSQAGAPAEASGLYEYVLEKAREHVPLVQKGVFGAHMEVSLMNDGPFTVIMDSSELKYDP